MKLYRYIVTMVDGTQIPFNAPNYDQAAIMAKETCRELNGEFLCFTSNDEFKAMVKK